MSRYPCPWRTHVLAGKSDKKRELQETFRPSIMSPRTPNCSSLNHRGNGHFEQLNSSLHPNKLYISLVNFPFHIMRLTYCPLDHGGLLNFSPSNTDFDKLLMDNFGSLWRQPWFLPWILESPPPPPPAKCFSAGEWARKKAKKSLSVDQHLGCSGLFALESTELLVSYFNRILIQSV